MEVEKLAGTLTGLLAPFLAPLTTREKGRAGRYGEVPDLILAVWSRLSPCFDDAPDGKHAAENLSSSPYDRRARSVFRSHLKVFLTGDLGLAAFCRQIACSHQLAPSVPPISGHPAISAADRQLTESLEMIHRLRSGGRPDEIAAGPHMSTDELFRLNTAFSTGGIQALIPGREVASWLEQIEGDDPLLRRYEMIRLVKTGTPVSVVAAQFAVAPDYVERIERRFTAKGVLALLDEDDVDTFSRLYPPTIRLCAYNLHGPHNEVEGIEDRFRLIGRTLAERDPHLLALQEVVSGRGVENTGRQTGRWLSAITGYRYRTEFAYCHQYMEKYDEGVATVTRSTYRNVRVLDLTRLRDNLRPSLERKAIAAETEVHGKPMVFVCVHLDHKADRLVRLAQGERLISEIEASYGRPPRTILAGDFNDTEESPVMEYLRAAGYRDAFRTLHKSGGETYPASRPEGRIDYILVKGDIKVVSSAVFLNDRSLSDHAAVFAEIL